MSNSAMSDQLSGLEIAVVSMVGRFPGARRVEEFWQNLCDGVESITFFTDDELESSVINPLDLHNPNYVKAGRILDDIELFDAPFFKINSREAEVMDPQQRLFLECAWEAVEKAGYDPKIYEGAIGVYGGVSMNTYVANLFANFDHLKTVGLYQANLVNDRDFLATRVSYLLGLKGPSMTVQTACSTSLVAIHLACQSLLSGECEMALAGGVSVAVPQKTGYVYLEGGISSPDGRCRAFDARAQGTVSGSGVGIVMLKRLGDALRDGDTIHAVIKGSAINNDGSLKVGYTAPSVDGQAQVIRMAQAVAGTSAESITYVETHGTGTTLGDPIEVAALTKAFRGGTGKKGFCAIGSVKTNVGHLDAAAGVTGFIKTVLALKHKMLPPSLNFEEPNPKINFEDSPFYVNVQLSPWEAKETHRRRAGVSSFGIGGTNAHVILEEAPPQESAPETRALQLLLLSARTRTALDSATENLAEHLKQNQELNLADAAYTLQVGRRAFSHRRMLVCRNLADGIEALETLHPKRVLTGLCDQKHRSAVFMFAGGGAQYVNMGRGIYETEETFRQQVDKCAALLLPHLGFDLRDILYPSPERAEAAAATLLKISALLPSLFVVEYALAQLWISWGVLPQVMIGHSLGEYVAACVSGVITLADALALVTARGRLMEKLPRGVMLSVELPEEEVRALLTRGLSLAAVNGASLCVVSGLPEAVAELERTLTERGIEFRRLQVDVAAHSEVLTPILGEFRQLVQQFKMRPPTIPYVSNVTGTWITAQEATDPNYWVSHLRETVRFADGIQTLLEEPERVFLEVGPGNTLSTLARPYVGASAAQTIISSLRHPHDASSDEEYLLTCLGRLWLAGVEVSWTKFHAGAKRLRLPLPVYPFERQRYWIDRRKPDGAASAAQQAGQQRKKLDEWFYAPSWKRTSSRPFTDEAKTRARRRVLLFADDCGIGERLSARLAAEGHQVVTVFKGERFRRIDAQSYSVNPVERQDYAVLLKELESHRQFPDRIVHLWSVTADADSEPGSELSDAHLALGFYSLLSLAQAIGDVHLINQLHLTVVSNNMQEVSGEEKLCPEKSTLLGACKVIPHEYEKVTCRSVDIALPAQEAARLEKLSEQLLSEIISEPENGVVAYRGNHRWEQNFETLRLDDGATRMQLRHGGVYLITGGLGGIGLALAKYLAEKAQPKLVLLGRSPLPSKDDWEEWLATHAETDEVSWRIRQLQEIESAGAEVFVVSADVSDEIQMRSIVEETRARFGGLHGVIHAAGVPGAGAIQLRAPELAESVFAAKIKGTRVLDTLFKDEPLDFMILCSGLNSILGSFGLANYCAANAFLDSFAHYKALGGDTRTMVVNWDRWQGVGMAVSVETMHKELSGEELGGGMKPEEATEAFTRVLTGFFRPQVIISVKDIQTLVDLNSAVRISRDAQEEPAAASAAKPAHPRPELTNSYVAPRNEIEQGVAHIWQELLGLEEVGIYDEFSDLGGHSLLATRLISRVRAAFNVEITLRSFFEGATVEALAANVEKALQDNQLVHTIPLKPYPRDGELPLSYAQQRLWFLDQLDPHSATYNISTAVRIRGPLDISALERTFTEIVRRHEVFRTSFVAHAGRPRQIISPPYAVSLQPEDLTSLPASEREAQARRRATEHAKQPFHLEEGQLLRTGLLELDADDHVVLLTVHHIISDGWSMSILVKELMTLYEAYSQGRESELPELAIQYADFAAWQREWLQGEVLEEQLGYWKEQLGDAPPLLELPTDYPRPAVQSYRGAHQSFELGEEEVEGLRQLSRQEGVTLFMLLLAAFKVLLHRYSGQQDVIVSTGIANRSQVETERLIGFFVNTLVLRTQVESRITFRELLKRVREVTMGAYAHQDVPFEMLVEMLQPERTLSYNPIAQVMFVLQNAPTETLKLPGLQFNTLGIESGAARFDLYLSVIEEPNYFRGMLEYSTDLFQSQTITRLLESFVMLLRGIAGNPDEEVGSMPMSSLEDTEQLIYEFNEE